MTDAAIATQSGDDAPRYLLIKRGLYYAPNNQGYTGLKDRAGRYPKGCADDRSGIEEIHEDDAPLFSKACWDDVKVNYLLDQLNAARAENQRLRDALNGDGGAA